MTHEELAQRIEALDGPCYDIFSEAWAFCYGDPMSYESVSDVGDRWSIFIDWLGAKAYLDAANALMPDGWEPVGVHWWQKSRCSAYSSRSDGRYAITTFAKTEPLARLAAAVRAHGRNV